MTKSLLGLEIDNGGLLLKFTQTTAETGGKLHAQEGRYPPRSPVPPYHCHPRQDERFVVVEGALKFRVDGVERIVRAGDAIDIPQGAFHLVHNPHAEPALVTWETRPALRTGEMFYKLARAAKGRARPRLVEAAAILSEYREEFQLAKPPPLVQRIVFGCLAPFGRRALRPIDP